MRAPFSSVMTADGRESICVCAPAAKQQAAGQKKGGVLCVALVKRTLQNIIGTHNFKGGISRYKMYGNNN